MYLRLLFSGMSFFNRQTPESNENILLKTDKTVETDNKN